MKYLLSLVILLSALLSACVTAPGPGAQEGATPPRLSMQNSMMQWDNVGAFGPVPAARAALGAQVCAKLNTAGRSYVPMGYHARAQGLDGKTLPDGGFFCVTK